MSERTTDFEREMKDAEFRRLFIQERTIVELTEMICREMKRRNVSQKELAQRLGKTKGHVSQLLSGNRNLTLRSLSDILLALDLSLEPVLRSAAEPRGSFMRISVGADGGAWTTQHVQLPKGHSDVVRLKLTDTPAAA